jgi:hypothetical protein
MDAGFESWLFAMPSAPAGGVLGIASGIFIV